MTKILITGLVASLFMLPMCQAQVATETPAAQTPQEGEAPQTKTVGEAEAVAAPVPTPVAFTDNIAKLSPENSRVGFVGRHVTEGDAPDPKQRLGGFREFGGEIHLQEDGTSVKAIVLDFKMDSLYTSIEDLTKHLKTSDFLNVQEHPEAKFVSTGITPGAEEGQYEIAGDFTLMGKTQPITMPCTVQMTEEGIVLNSEFNLDRTEFGMEGMTEKVSKVVSISFNVGLPTPAEEAPAPQQTMADRFKTMDVDGDGKLAGDEIPERMKQWMGGMDTDGDEQLSLEEMEAAMARFRKRGNSGGGDK